jgi:hypothetical protein
MKYAKPVVETAGKPLARSTTSAQSLFFTVGPTGEWNAQEIKRTNTMRTV